MEDFFSISTYLGTDLIALSFIWNSETLNGFIANVLDFSKFGRPRKTGRKIAELNRFSRYFLLCGLVISLANLSLVLNDKGDCERRKLLTGSEDICGMIVNVWMPFNVNQTFVHFLIFVQFTWNTTFYLFAIHLAGLVYTCSEILGLKADHFLEELELVLKISDEVERSERLKLCIQYHNHIQE